MQSSPASCYFIPLCPVIFLSTLLSKTLEVYSSLTMRGQVAHPYKAKNIIIFLYYILYLSFQMAVGKTKYSDSNSIISFGIEIKFH